MISGLEGRTSRRAIGRTGTFLRAIGGTSFTARVRKGVIRTSGLLPKRPTVSFRVLSIRNGIGRLTSFGNGIVCVSL